MKIRRSHIAPLSVTFVGAVLFLFVFTKSYVSSFTHDESYSYLNYCHEGFMEIISYSDWYPNNHVLNSLFMKYSEQLFGSSELALRLPNLLLLIVYMSYSYLFFRKTHPLLTAAMFILMSTNCLLMDLFGLARGYGLSCGFMVMSLYHFIAYLRCKRFYDLTLYHLAALLASLSNFILLTFYLSTLLAYNLVEFLHARYIRDERFRFFSSNKVHILPLLMAGIILYEPVRRVLSFNTYDFGGKTGFFHDTVSHLIFNVFHRVYLSPPVQLALQVIFTGLVCCCLFIIISMILSRNKDFFEHHLGFITVNFVFLLTCMVIILLHLIFGADYPVARFSIFLFPLFMIQIGFLAHYLISLKYGKVILTGMVLAALLSMVSYWHKADLHKSLEWAYDSKTKHMIQTLVSYHGMKHPCTRDIKLGIHWHFEPTINFYRETKGIDWLLPVDRNGFDDNDDYFYIYKHELHQLDASAYEVIKEYNDIQTLLLVNTTRTSRK